MKSTDIRQGTIDWRQIDTVLLDMDGTLLDRHFDDYFWLCYVPENYALSHGLEIDEARRRLHAEFERHQGTLAWSDLDFWSRELQLDIPALKRRIDALVAVHPYVTEFLEFCQQQQKEIYLVTNAHRQTLEIKMARAPLLGYCQGVVCAEEMGRAKEEAEFWPRLQKRLGYRKKSTMLADDNERVLAAAEQHGLGGLVHIARASSRSPITPSVRYTSIIDFRELISG